MNIPRFMIISSFRYALGRKTYIVIETCDWLRENINLIDDLDKKLMIEEIEFADNLGKLGMKCDSIEWKKLSDELKKTLK